MDTIQQLKSFYYKNFSIGNINGPFEDRLILISLICYVVKKAKEKSPGVTYYQIVYKLAQKYGLPDEFIVGLSIICENFAYGCDKFPTFGIEDKNIISKIQDIMHSYMPF